MKYLFLFFLLFASTTCFANYDYERSLRIQMQIVAIHIAFDKYEYVIDPADYYFIQDRLKTIERLNLSYIPDFSCDLVDMEILGSYKKT